MSKCFITYRILGMVRRDHVWRLAPPKRPDLCGTPIPIQLLTTISSGDDTIRNV